MNFTPIHKKMEQWLLNDKKIDAKTIKIREYTNLIVKARHDIKDTKNEIEATKNEIQNMNEQLTNLSVDYEMIKIQTEAWKQTFETANEEYNQKLIIWEDVETEIINLRQSFCDDVKKFIENYGVKATIKNIFETNVRQQLASALDVIDVNNDHQDSQMEDDQIFEFGQYLEEKNKNIHSNDEFSEMNAIDDETERLLNDIKNTKDETANYENEIAVLERRLDEMNTDILNNLFQDDIENREENENNWAFAKDRHGFHSEENSQFKSAKDLYESRFNRVPRSYSRVANNYSANLATSSQTRMPHVDPSLKTVNHQPTVQDKMEAANLNNNKRFTLVKSFKK